MSTQTERVGFSPLIFLASLGAGGISVIPFAFLQYTQPHPAGLVQRAQIDFASLSTIDTGLYLLLEAVMVIFATLHIVLSIQHAGQLWRFVRSPGYADFIHDPLKNMGIMAPFISIVMTMNVFIGPVRYFIPWMADNLQLLMLPALIFWALIYVALMRMSLRILKIGFVQKFDVNKLSFGWLLMPFALGMLTVTGTGIAALGHSKPVADTAAFMSLVSGSMGMFLLVTKLIMLFNRYFAGEGLGDRDVLPSFLIVIPNITLYAISLFRLGHYLEHHQGYHLEGYFTMVMGVAYAFETWYLLFGMTLLADYFRKDYAKNHYYVTLWGLICPMVAYAVLSSFAYKVVLSTPVFYGLSIVFMIIAVTMFADILSRYWRCRSCRHGAMQCA